MVSGFVEGGMLYKLKEIPEGFRCDDPHLQYRFDDLSRVRYYEEGNEKLNYWKFIMKHQNFNLGMQGNHCYAFNPQCRIYIYSFMYNDNIKEPYHCYQCDYGWLVDSVSNNYNAYRKADIPYNVRAYPICVGINDKTGKPIAFDVKFCNFEKEREFFMSPKLEDHEEFDTCKAGSAVYSFSLNEDRHKFLEALMKRLDDEREGARISCEIKLKDIDHKEYMAKSVLDMIG